MSDLICIVSPRSNDLNLLLRLGVGALLVKVAVAAAVGLAPITG